jgi:hypothetical protein
MCNLYGVVGRTRFSWLERRFETLLSEAEVVLGRGMCATFLSWLLFRL